MRLAGRLLLEQFGTGHPDAGGALDAWVAEVRNATWATPHELKEQYSSASIIGGGRVVFNIRGNRYRLLALIDYKNQQCVIEKIGTHHEYDTWDL
jgi:mRNA interferase HigB